MHIRTFVMITWQVIFACFWPLTVDAVNSHEVMVNSDKTKNYSLDFDNFSSRHRRNVMHNRILYNNSDTVFNGNLPQDTAKGENTDKSVIVCSKQCLCEHAGSAISGKISFLVDCSSLDITFPPSDIPSTTEILKLSANKITPRSLVVLKSLTRLRELHLEANHILNWDKDTIMSADLGYLILDQNDIYYIGNNSFNLVPNLVYLSLAQNRLETMARNSFIGLGRLETLILSDNRISEIDPAWFKFLINLRHLELQNNVLQTLNDGDFKYLSNLELLHLQGNQLNVIHDKAFYGLQRLSKLYLQDNSLHVVPSIALKGIPRSDVIDLSGNSLQIIFPDALHSVNVTSLKLNTMTYLIFIDKGSFVDLLYLQRLEITDCSSLIYIDNSAFVNVPNLLILHIYNNALISVQSVFIASFPVLKYIDMRGNKLNCDCTTSWVHTRRNLTVLNLNDTKCLKPDQFKGISLSNTTIFEEIPLVCEPKIVPLFRRRYDVMIGESVTLYCKATGNPPPSVSWSLYPKRKVDLNIPNIRHKTLSDKLFIDFLHPKDAGTYICRAENQIGTASFNSTIRIRPSAAYVIVSRVTSTSVTVTWANTYHGHGYELIHWRSDQINETTGETVGIEPYMREYTLSGLRPSTTYTVCVAIKYLDHVIPVNCSTVQTRDWSYSHVLHDSRNLVLGGSIATLVLIIVTVCLASYCCRRLNNKKSPDSRGDSLSQLYGNSPDHLSDAMPIAYENRMAEIYDFGDTEGVGFDDDVFEYAGEEGQCTCGAELTTSLSTTT